MRNSYCLRSYDIGESPSNHLINLISKHNIEYHSKLLDYGSGSGRNSLFFANMVEEIHSVDISEFAIEKLNNKTKNLGISNIFTYISDFASLPFKNNSFDYVIAWRVLHIGNLEQISHNINEIIRVMKPEGLLFCAVASKYGAVYSERLKKYGSINTNTIHYISKGRIHTKTYYDLDLIEHLFGNFSIGKIYNVEEKSGHSNKNHQYLAFYGVKNE